MTVSKDTSTPMMRQYLELKEQYPDTLVFYRLGDFYEMFYEDAVKASRLLNLTLTRRGTNNGQPIPLAGVPFHAADNYISRLIKMGESVVVCEQIEEKTSGKTKNFSRKISRIVTPGTATDDGIAPDRVDNLIACVCEGKSYYGLAYLSLGSGRFKTAVAGSPRELSLYLDKIAPAEIVFPEDFKHQEIFASIKSRKALPGWNFELQSCYRLLCQQFQTQTLFGFDIENIEDGICAAGALLSYVKSTQNCNLEHIRSIGRDDNDSQIILDSTAQRNLELTENLRGEYFGSLLSVIDKTATAMGSRRLRRMILEPLRDDAAVNARLDVVEALLRVQRADLFELLDGIGDLERITARIGLSSARPKDLMVLREALKAVPAIRDFLRSTGEEKLMALEGEIKPLPEVCDLLSRALMSVPATFIRDGGVFADGYSEELDSLRALMNGSADVLAAMELREREATGISTLKVNYNSVSGYYIEVSRAQASKVPEHYHRKQTLKNNERYTTAELRELEDRTLTAQERALALEKELYDELIVKLQEVLPELSALAHTLSGLDALLSFAAAADSYHYVRPKLSNEGVIRIEEARHPVIETISGKPFVANDVDLEQKRMIVITGPNMGGKSTYMRSVALICVMARAGCFVPAKSALVGDVDRIFTRIGASDDLVSGRSTFMVEMEEASSILNNATPKSLVIMDEIGRGTSAVEGAALALSIATFLTRRARSLTLFSTHYAEVTGLSEKYPEVAELCFKAEEHGGKIVFLYHAYPGSSKYSYAVEVGKLAGLPLEVINNARLQILRQEQEQEHRVDAKEDGKDAADTRSTRPEIVEVHVQSAAEARLAATDINNLTPLQALNLLSELKGML